jgi:hypothetical protein
MPRVPLPPDSGMLKRGFYPFLDEIVRDTHIATIKDFLHGPHEVSFASSESAYASCQVSRPK